MTGKSATIDMLMSNYTNFYESINRVMGIDSASFDRSSQEVYIYDNYKKLNKLSQIKTCSNDGEVIYDWLIGHIEIILRDEISKIFSGCRNILEDCEYIFTNLINQIIDKTPPTVKILSFFHAQTQSKNTVCKLLEKYPVLASSLDEYIHHCLLLLEDFSSRLLKDKDTIQNRLKINTFRIKKITIGLGDHHEVGDGVIHCEFVEKSIIYKTRSARNESLVTEILKIIRSDTYNCLPGIPETIDKEYYSWHENIDFEDSKSIDDVKQFYRTSGASIAFFYATGGVDFHYENIICNNNTPYFIDLECIFSGPVKFNELSDSILSTYILPILCGSPTERYRCGLGIRDSGEGHSYDSKFTLNGESVKKQIKNYFNRPVNLICGIHGQELKNEIIKGFNIMVDALKKNSHDILETLKKTNPIHGRILLRPTKFYADILAISSHPRYSSIPFYRDCFIACALSQNEMSMDVISYEFQALKNWKIPAFYTDIVNRKCYGKDKRNIEFDARFNDLNKLIDNFISFTTDMTSMKYHMTLMSASIDFLFADKPERVCSGSERSSGKKHNASDSINFILSGKMQFKGKHLYLNFIRNEKYESTCRVMSMDCSLYHGLGGALFMCIANYIHKPDPTKKRKITDLYLTCNNIIKRKNKSGFGAFEHTGSMLYLNYLLFKYLKCDSFINSFTDVLDLILKRKKNGTWSMDIIDGVSGLLIVSCRMYNLVPLPIIYNAISYFCEVIIKNTLKINDSDGFISWGKKLTGFAHGNSGVVYALLLANEILKWREIESLAFNALKYEHSCKIKSGWKDMRYTSKETDFNSWCHGSPGVYLSRNAILDDCPSITPDIHNLIKEDISHYHDSGKLRKINHEFSLCHGIFGNSMIDKIPCEFVVELDEKIEERSLMSGKTGAAYANLYFLHIGEDFPNILLLK